MTSQPPRDDELTPGPQQSGPPGYQQPPGPPPGYQQQPGPSAEYQQPWSSGASHPQQGYENHPTQYNQPPPGGYQQAPPGAYGQQPTKKKRRIFLWVFLAVQALFIIWIIAGIAQGSGQPSDCQGLSAQTCNDASDVGTGIGVALVVVLWMVVDFLLAVVYGVYRLAKRT